MNYRPQYEINFSESWVEKPRLFGFTIKITVCLMCLGALPFSLMSCATLDLPNRSSSELPLPAKYSQLDENQVLPDRSRISIETEELTQLITMSLSGNFSLQQAYARLDQAGAIAKQSRAYRFPSLTFSGESSVSRVHTDTGSTGTDLNTVSQKIGALATLLTPAGSAVDASSGADSSLELAQSAIRTAQGKVQALETLLTEPVSSSITSTNESFKLGLVSSYELDLWGKLHANSKASLLEYNASIEDILTARQSLISEVTLTWLNLILQKQMLALVQEQLETNQATLQLIELRHRMGMANALDVYQQQQLVEAARASLPPLEGNMQLLLHELAVLAGKPPQTDLNLREVQFPILTPRPELGLPAELLAQRPDVRASGLLLQASDLRVKVAQADRLPGIQLTGSASFGSNDWELLFNNWAATLAGSITAAVFDAGQRKAEVERTMAVVDERLASYKDSVLRAVREVEDALALENMQITYFDVVEVQLALAQATCDEAVLRYRKGLSDYLPVLSAISNLQTLQRTHIQAKHDLLSHRVALHRALGGSWENETLWSKEF